VTQRSLLPADLRAHHRGMLLRLLDEQGAMTRGELTDRTGLSLPTVASIVSDLVVRGCVTEVGLRARSARRGPRAAAVALKRTAYQAVGVYLGATDIWVGRCDLSGAVVGARRIPVPSGASPPDARTQPAHGRTPPPGRPPRRRHRPAGTARTDPRSPQATRAKAPPAATDPAAPPRL